MPPVNPTQTALTNAESTQNYLTAQNNPYVSGREDYSTYAQQMKNANSGLQTALQNSITQSGPTTAYQPQAQPTFTAGMNPAQAAQANMPAWAWAQQQAAFAKTGGAIPATVTANHQAGSANPWEQNWNTSPAMQNYNINPNHEINPLDPTNRPGATIAYDPTTNTTHGTGGTGVNPLLPQAPTQYQQGIAATPFYQTPAGQQVLAAQNIGRQFGLNGETQDRLASKLGRFSGGGKFGQPSAQVPSP